MNDTRDNGRCYRTGWRLAAWPMLRAASGNTLHTQGRFLRRARCPLFAVNPSRGKQEPPLSTVDIVIGGVDVHTTACKRDRPVIFRQELSRGRASTTLPGHVIDHLGPNSLSLSLSLSFYSVCVCAIGLDSRHDWMRTPTFNATSSRLSTILTVRLSCPRLVWFGLLTFVFGIALILGRRIFVAVSCGGTTGENIWPMARGFRKGAHHPSEKFRTVSFLSLCSQEILNYYYILFSGARNLDR